MSNIKLRTWPKQFICLAAWAYLLFILAIWLLLRAGSDRWLIATLILFGPRWILSVPLIVLVPLAAWFARPHLAVLFMASVILFGPVMNFCLPFVRGEAGGPVIRVLTCNVGGPALDVEKLRRAILESGADVVALQECSKEAAGSAMPGWKTLQEQNLAVVSRYPIIPVQKRQAMHPPHRWPRTSLLQCRIQAPGGEISLCSVHLPSPRYGLSNLLDRNVGINLFRINGLKEEREIRWKTSREIESLIRRDSAPVIIAGDFNMPVESALYRQSWKGYVNAFSAVGFGYGLTENVEIRGFKFGVRIDHVLIGGSLAASRCWVGPDVGSDHLPLIAEIRINAGPKNKDLHP